MRTLWRCTLTGCGAEFTTDNDPRYLYDKGHVVTLIDDTNEYEQFVERIAAHERIRP